MSDDQPTTKQLPAADPVQVLLLKLQRGMEAGFEHVGERLDRQDTVLSRVAAEGVEVNTRLTRIEVRVEHAEKGVEDLEARIGRTSSRVREGSQTTLETESRLAQEIVARQATDAKLDSLTASQETQLAILSRLDKFAANPNIKIILAVLATALMSWAASKGLNK